MCFSQFVPNIIIKTLAGSIYVFLAAHFYFMYIYFIFCQQLISVKECVCVLVDESECAHGLSYTIDPPLILDFSFK